MQKSSELYNCLLGSLLLGVLNNPTFYNTLHNFPIIGFYLSQTLYIISTLGIALTIFFSILLIKNNFF